MLAPSLVAFLHFVFAFALVAAVFFEWLTFGRAPTHREASRIAKADAVYGLSALAILVVGALRVLYFAKGTGFYLPNPFFHLKMTLFVAMGLVSIYPTVVFMRWRPALRAGQAPALGDSQHRWVARCLALQLVLAVGVVLSASLMAQGVAQGVGR